MSEDKLTTNPLTGRPLSQRYYSLLEKRSALPIYGAKRKIQKLVRKYQIVLLVGETGCGKTTQVPSYILEMEPDLGIACTQPRRVAATSVSERVATELDVELGEEVGYCIRFDNKSNDKTKIKYMTDGMLLREAMIDPMLSKYSVIIIDEAHERTMDTDVLLGVMKPLLQKRPELRLLVMSATLEREKFQRFFPSAPIVDVSGRMFGVDVFYTKAPESNYVEAAIRTALQIHLFEGPGDVLIFLCGEDEIEQCVERLEMSVPNAIETEQKKQASLPEKERREVCTDPVVLLPLYSALPPQKQRRVFETPSDPRARKIVVATNIAETSLTIDGVVFVVDCGFSKQKIFNPKLRIESLLVTPISQASAEQRAGRAGRTKPGKCFRLYTSESFKTQLPLQTHPEILRSNLASVILDMKMMGVDNLVTFDFIDPPAPLTLMRALELLNWMGALDLDGNLTEYGKQMALFPVEPELASMMLKGREWGCAAEMAQMAAMLSIQTPFLSGGAQYQGGAARARDQWQHPTGDHLSLLTIFQAYLENGGQRGGSQADQWAKDNFLHHRNLAQASSIYRQLLGHMKRHDLLEPTTEGAKRAAECVKVDPDGRFSNHIRRAILAGFFTKVAMALPSKGEYQPLKDNAKAIIFPGSFLKHRPSMVIYNEIVLTSNTYLRTVTSISDDWLLEAAGETDYFNMEEFEKSPTIVQTQMKSIHRNAAPNAAKKQGKKQLRSAQEASSDESD